MFKEFKEFILKGNVLDLAVAFIIGAAFKAIITSLVNDLLMPVLSIVTGGVSFTDLKYIITPASGDLAEVAIRYGAFIQIIIDFLIVAFSIFLIIKLINKSKKKEEEVVEAPAEPGVEEVLLTEIRDLLKK